MARKLAENDFWMFSPLPPKKIGYVKKKLPNMKKIKIVQNCMEWRENWSKTIFVFFSPPPPKKNPLNGRGPQWKMTSMEDNLNERRPQRKMTSIEDDLNGRRP